MAQLEMNSAPGSAPPVGSTSIVLQTEHDLRNSFDQHAAALVAAAASKLGDSGYLAPKVVEQAFVAAWHQREGITSEPQLAGFLASEVEHGAARTLSRQLAAHRLAHHGAGGGGRDAGHARPNAAYDPEVSWSHVVQGMRADVRSSEAHVRAAAIAHHEAALHIKEATREGSWVKPVLVGAATVAFAIAAVWAMDRIGDDARIRNAVTTGPVRTVAAPAGQLGALELADGSQVRLAPETELIIPSAFGPDLRAVRIVGAARIAVAPGLAEPLTVIAGPATIVATGTAFTVRAYPLDGGTTVSLHEGRVTVRAHDSTHVLAPGEAIHVPEDAAARTPTAGEVAEAASWLDNTYAANDRRLGDVLDDFRRWYGTQIFIADPTLLDRRVTFRASLDSVRQAISAVEREGGVRFGYVSGKMVFLKASAADGGR